MGLSLSIWTELQVTINPEVKKSNHSLNCRITYEGEGEGNVPLEADHNLITRTALYVLRCHGIREFPCETHVHIINRIPLGRGLGSSGAAVVGGVILGNVVGKLGLSKDRMMDYCLMIERHPDNVTAAMIGGFVGSYLRELNPEDTERKEIPLAEVLPEPAGGTDTGLQPPEPPVGIGHYIKFGWAKEIKAITIIPQFELATAKARGVLPTTYSAKDMVCIFSYPFMALFGVKRKLDLQSSAPGCPNDCTYPFAPGCGIDIPGNAGQGPPALSQISGKYP